MGISSDPDRDGSTLHDTCPECGQPLGERRVTAPPPEDPILETAEARRCSWCGQLLDALPDLSL